MIYYSDEELLLKATYIIEGNISDPTLNVDNLCKELGISKGMLYIKLKNLTGKNVDEFIRVFRLEKSKALLLEGKLNTKQISVELGFNTTYFFTRSFSKHFGVSPRQFVIEKDPFLTLNYASLPENQ